jgi:hypothetical protein
MNSVGSKIPIPAGNVISRNPTGAPIVGDPKDGYPFNPNKTYEENIYNCKNYWREKNCADDAFKINYPGIVNKMKGEKKYPRRFSVKEYSQPGRQYNQPPSLTEINPDYDINSTSIRGGKQTRRSKQSRSRKSRKLRKSRKSRRTRK